MNVSMLITVLFTYIESTDDCSWSAGGSIQFTQQSAADAWIADNADWICKPQCTVNDVDVVINNPEHTLLTDVPCLFVEQHGDVWVTMDPDVATLAA